MTITNHESPITNHGFSAVSRIFRPVFRDLLLVAIAHRQQHLLGVQQIATPLAVVLENARFDYGVHRAGLLTETAEDALGEVDVVAGGTTRAVGALLRVDGDGERRAHRF